MSPLLTTRPSESVARRLRAACAGTAALAIVIALSGGRPAGAAPALMGAGAVCAALVAYLLAASARMVHDGRLRWIAAGATVACAGLLADVLGQAAVFPDEGPVSQSLDAMSARYTVWHAALAAAALLAALQVAATRGRVLALTVSGLALLAWCALLDEPLGDLVNGGGKYTGTTKLLIGALVVVLAVSATAWWRSAGRSPAWGAMCVIAALYLSALDALAYLFAGQPYSDAWWASTTLRAGQFVIPSVGLVMGFVRLADKLRELQEEIEANFEQEHERAAREEELASADRVRRERLARRIRRLTAGEGLDIALQPIVELTSGELVGAEALARFTDEDGATMATEPCLQDAHALGLGTELELAAVRLALACHDRLADGLYLALNISPAVLTGSELPALMSAHEHGPLVVELTEHEPVEDYAALGRSLDALRAHGVRVAIDDVGSGFSSFRHVTRVNPEILKLDRSLVSGIHDDPVRQSLAAAIVAFAADVGAVVVSEGIESEPELECLRDLAVGLGQGFLFGRPRVGAAA